MVTQDEIDALDLLLLLSEAEKLALYTAVCVLRDFDRRGWAPFKDDRVAPVLRLLGRLTVGAEGQGDTSQVINQILRTLIAGGTAEPASEKEGST